MSKKIGVFVCHCGQNIAGVVNVERVVSEIKKYPRVVHVIDYKYICSDPGQNIIKQAIKDFKLDGMVIAACSPTLHERTFRKLATSAGLNPYKFENANIREQCSWVHEDKEAATEKAIYIIKSAIAKLALDIPLKPIEIPIKREALVIGGGIAGMQAALDIANAGYKVYLVEKLPSIGGKMAQLSKTFPNLEYAQCILTPKMVEVKQHENIKLLVSSEIEEVTGYVGNFSV
ncbi:MAG: FAD-dependent oxidoreductase, partial [Methanocellales archaeon]